MRVSDFCLYLNLPAVIPFSSGIDVSNTLKQLAERRTDIFGKGGEETMIGKKVSF